MSRRRVTLALVLSSFAIAAADLEGPGIAGDQFRFPAQFPEPREHLVTLREARERPHAHALDARVADDGLRRLKRGAAPSHPREHLACRACG